jgi:hypothetical protein
VTTTGTTAQVLALGHDENCRYELDSLSNEYEDIAEKHPETREAADNAHKVLQDIVSLAG